MSNITATSPLAFGELGRCPPEIRFMIWEYFVCRNSETQPARKDSLAIMRLNRALHREISLIIYKRQVLTFRHLPLTRVSHLSTGLNEPFLVENTQGKVRSYNNATAHQLQYLPYDRIRALWVIIERPDRRDPGQHLRLSYALTPVASLFAAIPAIRFLGFQFVDSADHPQCSWNFIGQMTSSLKEYTTCLEKFLFRRNDSLLFPFFRIRNIKNIRIIRTLCDRRTHIDIQDHPLLFFLRKKQIFGGSPVPGEWDSTLSDTVLQFKLEAMPIILQDALDYMPGWSARYLRLHRFATWFSDKDCCNRDISVYTTFLRNAANLMLGTMVAQCSPSSSLSGRVQLYLCTCMQILNSRLHWRTQLVHAFNPDSQNWNTLLQKGFGLGNDPWLYGGWKQDHQLHLHDPALSRLFRCFGRAAGHEHITHHPAYILNRAKCEKEDGWDTARWYRMYPTGLPPLTRNRAIMDFADIMAPSYGNSPQPPMYTWHTVIMDEERAPQWLKCLRCFNNSRENSSHICKECWDSSPWSLVSDPKGFSVRRQTYFTATSTCLEDLQEVREGEDAKNNSAEGNLA